MNIRLPKVGDRVNVIEKRNYESGQLASGVVRRTLSNPNEVHPYQSVRVAAHPRRL